MSGLSPTRSPSKSPTKSPIRRVGPFLFGEKNGNICKSVEIEVSELFHTAAAMNYKQTKAFPNGVPPRIYEFQAVQCLVNSGNFNDVMFVL